MSGYEVFRRKPRTVRARRASVEETLPPIPGVDPRERVARPGDYIVEWGRFELVFAADIFEQEYEKV